MDGNKTHYRIKTLIKSTDTFERVSQHEGLEFKKDDSSKWHNLTQDNFPWDKIFVSGYGAGSRTQGTEDFQHYLAVDAVYSIFKPNASLQNPELTIRRLIDTARQSQKKRKDSKSREDEILTHLKEILSGLLQLKSKDSIHLSRTGIEVKGSWGKSEIGELGDGYRSTITWVLDLLSWWFLRISSRGGYLIKNINGIVFVDEIEQHLHPLWQRNILPLLESAFPKIQFIISTHSPLCAAGTADIGTDKYQIINMNRLNGSVEPRIITLPVGYRADQILTSEAFGLSDTRNPETEKKILEYRFLSQKKSLNKKQKRSLEKLRLYTQKLPEIGQYEEERKVRAELRDLVNQLNKIRPTGKQND